MPEWVVRNLRGLNWTERRCQSICNLRAFWLLFLPLLSSTSLHRSCLFCFPFFVFDSIFYCIPCVFVICNTFNLAVGRNCTKLLKGYGWSNDWSDRPCCYFTQYSRLICSYYSGNTITNQLLTTRPATQT